MFQNLKIVILFSAMAIVFSYCANKKTPSKKVNCLSELVIFADTVNLDTSTTLESHFKSYNSQAISECDLNTFRNSKQLNKAVSSIIFKINYYFIQKGWGKNEDLLPLYSISPFLNKILDEGIYMQTKKERQGQEIQILTASSLATFVLNDSTLSNDKELILLVEKCYPNLLKKKNLTKLPNDSLQIENSATQTSGKLQTETITITVSYAAIACGCPQWFETKFKKEKFLNDVTRFYLEPTNKRLVNANDLWDGQTLPLKLKLIGRFSKHEEMPKTYHTKTSPEKARIFWYDKIIIISNLKTLTGASSSG